MNRRRRRVVIGILAVTAVGLAGSALGWTVGASAPLLSGVLAAGAFCLGAGAISVLGGMGVSAATPGLRLARTGTAEVRALRHEVDEARAELDAIHSSVSHDLRSPIGAALNFLTVLEEDHGDQLDADGRAILARIRRSADSALSLLDGLARLARVGRKPMAPRLVDVDALVRSVFAAARPPERSVDLHIDEPLPAIVADPELLRSAFSELISNAVRFTSHAEKASVSVGARHDDEANTVDYWVADDGVGFDERFAAKLFHVFERLHSREEFPGAGAGLAVVRRIAERHGGSVRAEGVPGRGATFHLMLPADARVERPRELAS